MDKDRIRYLIEKFSSAELNDSEQREVEKLIEEGRLNPDNFPGLMEMKNKLDEIFIPEPGSAMNQRFYSMLHGKIKNQKIFGFKEIAERLFTGSLGNWSLQSVVFILLILAGFLIGYVVKGGQNSKQINRLSDEVNQVHEMLMINLLDNPEASDRLKAVDLTTQMTKVDDTVIDALLNTLNHDENTNVRLAAIDALYKYSSESQVRKGFVMALAYQKSPIVLVTLADVLVSLHETGSVEKLKLLLNEKDINKEVKEKIEDSIKKMS